MTGKVLNNGTAGVLVLILPIALAITIVFTAWPFLLLLITLIVGWKIWENYQWQKWCQQVNPYFNQLIVENKGCLTAMDLSLKANLTGRSAKQFLARKAEEFGAQRKEIQDKGTVYYFLTVSALGSIFKDSDIFSDEEEEKVFSSSQQPSLLANAIAEADKQPSKPSFSELAQLANQQEEAAIAQDIVTETEESEELEESETIFAENSHLEATSDKNALIQADLAKRLDINPSTVGRRKSDPDFPEWSQSKDPEGIAWKYMPKTKMFVPVE